MTKAWGTGYSGDAKARFPNGDLHPVFIMVQRDPVIPEDGDLTTKGYDQDEDYEGWWGYLRYVPNRDQPPLHEIESNGFLIIEPEERLPPEPRRGWPGNSLIVDLVMPRPSNRGFETLIREHVEAAASDED